MFVCYACGARYQAQAPVCTWCWASHSIAIMPELAESNIRVCAVAPGYVATPRIMESGKDVTDWMASLHPVKRLADRSEVADLVAYLLSERASFMTGSVHCIDGGYTAQ